MLNLPHKSLDLISFFLNVKYPTMNESIILIPGSSTGGDDVLKLQDVGVTNYKTVTGLVLRNGATYYATITGTQ